MYRIQDVLNRRANHTRPPADPRVAEDQQIILSKLENCEFDAIFDVRSQDYYDNWRLSGGEHLPDASRFDASRLAAENITSVAFYCWNAPWQSEPAAQWFASQYGDQGVAVYDIKGLTYLDDIPGMCQYIDGNDAAVAEYSPHCAEEGAWPRTRSETVARVPCQGVLVEAGEDRFWAGFALGEWARPE